MGKLESRESIQKLLGSRQIVLVTGVFDLFHAGHKYLLEQAKHYGHVVIGVNSDRAVKEMKGFARPIESQDARVRKVAKQPGVKYAFIFDEIKNDRNFEIIKPDIYIKSENPKPCEAELIKKYNVQFVKADMKAGISTTKKLSRKLAE